jgi:hypothetical protein
VLHEFTNLPPLTTDQANVVAAVLTAGPSLMDMAEATHYDLAHFLDLYASPEVGAHIRAAKHAATDHATIRLTEAAHAATQVLETLAQDTDNDKTERRRAATTILRCISPRHERRRHARVSRQTQRATEHDAFDDLLRSLVHAAEGSARQTPATVETDQCPPTEPLDSQPDANPHDLRPVRPRADRVTAHASTIPPDRTTAITVERTAPSVSAPREAPTPARTPAAPAPSSPCEARQTQTTHPSLREPRPRPPP